jgi:hypothetical protein
MSRSYTLSTLWCLFGSSGTALLLLYFASHKKHALSITNNIGVKYPVKNPEWKKTSEDLVVHGRTILKCMLSRRVGIRWLDSSGSEQGPVAGSCEHDNKTCSMKDVWCPNKATISFSITVVFLGVSLLVTSKSIFVSFRVPFNFPRLNTFTSSTSALYRDQLSLHNSPPPQKSHKTHNSWL